MNEVRAAQAFGLIYDPSCTLPHSWQTLPRYTRAVLTAYVRVDQYTRALTDYDDAMRARNNALSGR